MKIIHFSSLILLFVSCTSFSSFYTPYFDASMEEDVVILQPNQEPEIFSSNNIDHDFFEILSYNYECVGDTGFNGPDRDITYSIKQQCFKNGATLAIYSKEYSDTRYGTITIPGTQTTTHSGSIYGNGGYGSYRGTSTSTTLNNYNYSVRRYDYQVYYFVQSTSESKFGWWLTDLDGEERQKYKRNTGAIVFVIYKNSPAFNANIFRDDIIIRINENIINNMDDYYNIYDDYNIGDEIEVELIRDGRKIIEKIKIL
jgi:hypothetical protein